MRDAFAGPDVFEVLNGPEDGAAFPVTSRAFSIGADPACAIAVRFDPAVLPHHARVSVVPDGYRVRRADQAPVLVNGKRAGFIRSRIVRSGDNVQVGQTLLGLECSPDGLASRSRGVVTENDIVWALRHGGRNLFRWLRRVALCPMRLFGKLAGSWLTVVAALILLYALWPGFRWHVGRVASTIYRYVLYGIERLLNS